MLTLPAKEQYLFKNDKINYRSITLGHRKLSTISGCHTASVSSTIVMRKVNSFLTKLTVDLNSETATLGTELHETDYCSKVAIM